MLSQTFPTSSATATTPAGLSTLEKLRFRYRATKARYRDERLELAALTQALRPDDIAIDIGAYKGSYLPSLSHAVPQGQVVAFEPQAALAHYLQIACSSIGLHNVRVEAAGVSSSNSSQILSVPGQGAPSPGATLESRSPDQEACTTETVPVIRLDDYFAGVTASIGAIKVDVEGHELSVLKGAHDLITRHRPVILCECEARHHKSGDIWPVLDAFGALGYSGRFACRGQWLPLSRFRPEIHQERVGPRYWDHPDYCNNFLFRSKSD